MGLVATENLDKAQGQQHQELSNEVSNGVSGGILYVVATPIGTLQDFSPRARQILAEVDFIACEDTRHTAKLLGYFGIKTPLVSLHQHNEKDKSNALLQRLVVSPRKTAALVTDAGTPGVSDPGAYFVGLAHEAGVQVLSVPGPSALSAALGACGFLAPRALFCGFFPRERRARQQEWQLWQKAAPCIIVCYESPNRLLETLTQMQEALPNTIEVCVSREISKKFEEHVRGPLDKVIAKLAQMTPIKGEIVITINIGTIANEGLYASLQEASQACLKIAEAQNINVKQACKIVSEQSHFSAKEIYSFALEIKKHDE